ncbi:MAG: glycosyltransferase family 2 protein [Thiotrichales bacterium]|nr:glycosyltransferase family 2 protein [Thiotrichales bacterium]
MKNPPLLPNLEFAEACTLSVIVPVFNEQESLITFHHAILQQMQKMSISWELIYVDDGSHDGSRALLKKLCVQTPQASLLAFSRNFGKESAMSAGLALAKGEAVVIMDADLQDPPSVLPQMLEAWRAGADVVNMRRRSRAGETWLKRWTAQAFYQVMNRMASFEIPQGIGDFRLLSRRAVEALNQLPESNRFMKGLFSWVGFPQVILEYDRDPRVAGQSKWNYWKLWNFALEGITSFSVAPLKLSTYLGFLIAFGAFAYAFFFLFKTLLIGDATPGFPTLIIVVLFLGGTQLMAIGILGEYLGRLYHESKRRPLYLVEEYLPPRDLLTESNAPQYKGRL